MAFNRFSGDGFFGDNFCDGDNVVCAYLDGIFLLSVFSHVKRSGPTTMGVFTFRVNGSSFGFLALGELEYKKKNFFDVIKTKQKLRTVLFLV